MTLVRYFHTLRHLQPGQIYGRLWQRFYHPTAAVRPTPGLRSPRGNWRVPSGKLPSLVAPNRFRFLNQEHDILSASDWNRPDWPKLWVYNLHYFDDANVIRSPDSEWLGWHRELMVRWVAENPATTGTGWEPYPLSLRIVNWIKWALAGRALPQAALESLPVQARYLRKRLEFHLRGNHLLANAKALIFAGLFFDGSEADGWLDTGLRILQAELPEQILEDGGHFERSPMYHVIVLEDLLDVVNLLECYSARGQDASFVAEPASRMLGWMTTMCHPDGQVGLFNDAAFGIAPHPAEVLAYAHRLGLGLLDAGAEAAPVEVTHLAASGYMRVENGPMIALLDVARIGPDYLPGHAHADTLSFEMSLFGQRTIVNSGTSRYDDGPERSWQRGTAAHSTVVIDGQDSSEVWGSFRVARRARPFGLQVKDGAGAGLVVRCAHDGYRRLPGRPVHWREWAFDAQSLGVRDSIEGASVPAVGRFYFPPGLRVIPGVSATSGSIDLPEGERVHWSVVKGSCRIVDSQYHPEFGLSCRGQCLEVQLDGGESHVVFTWQ